MLTIGDLPERVLLEVLARVPARNLLCNCRLVCSQWRRLVDDPELWKIKFQRKSGPETQESKAFFIYSHREKNLIKNPCGKEGLDSWAMRVPSEGHWKTEELSEEDLAALPMESFLQRNSYAKKKDSSPQWVNRCFAACDGLCSKAQLIILKDLGYWDELIDEARPNIAVNEYYYCPPGSRYQLSVKLLDADFQLLHILHTEGRGSEAPRWRRISQGIIECRVGLRYILFEHLAVNGSGQPPENSVRVTRSSVTLGPFNWDEDFIEPFPNSDDEDGASGSGCNW
ncbi:F-box only protein 44-like [Podarcis raffonei]|uniref:F-box only protein 44-like n=1 Tax=Podarcis raffonei TaxID=65483 RepID=UPI00232972E6|nr:F-box only protein 44-like [Podarcis raffonei]XP_053256950.1 F-box only protein 44-like [Podarcis raffonei]